MGSPTVEFFEGLRRRGHAPALGRYTGSMRFDLSDGGRVHHWRVAVSEGDVTVSRDEGEADCVISGERELFDQVALGRVNPLVAWLSNRVAVQGAFRPLVLLERLLPEPADAHDPRDLVGEHGRRR
jgi:hypothetical protein